MRPPAVARTVVLFSVLAAGSLVPSQASADPDPGLPRERPGRGLVYGGLRPARGGGPCDAGHAGHYEIRSRTGTVLGCTHGPDPAPAGENLRSPSTASLGADLPADAGAVPCIGDGTSGFRVQAIYAYPADMASRYGAVAPLIRGWASANVDDVVNASAAEAGASRRVRFVTDASCQLVVTQVALTAAGDDTFSNTINQLRSQGYTRSDRKYLVWMDTPAGRSSVYCGIGQLYLDESASAGNLNNGNDAVPGMVARVDAGCWGSTGTPVEAHELMHNLGAVQNGAPHSTSRFGGTAGGHCTDDYDVMCYDDDGAGAATTTIVCPDIVSERRLDCGDDDYFSVQPVAGSYLATHWNTADSRFLEAGTVSNDDSDGGAPGLSLTASRKRVRPGARVQLTVRAPACAEGHDVELVAGARSWTRALGGACTVSFGSRVRRPLTFRAFAYDEVGDEVGTSGRVRIRVRRP